MNTLSLKQFLLFRNTFVFCLAAFLVTNAGAQDWKLLSPATFPSARRGLAMTYDEASQKVILFGGYNGNYLNDTWAFDGKAWTKIKNTAAPPRRSNGQMAYDVVTKRVVLFGGYNGSNWLGDTWLFDGVGLTWTQANPAHSPRGVTGPLMFTDPNGHVDKFGGFDGEFYDATFWRWKGSDWQRLHPSQVPSGRSSAVVGLNKTLNQVVLFAGLAAVNPVNTWTYDGKTWTMQNVSRQPPWVYYGSAAFEPTLKSVIAFGGGNNGIEQNSTWAWNGTRWKQLFPTHLPTPREGAGMAYDSTLNHIIIFGGQNQNTFLNDTWEFVP
jgi:hypothetical protein